MPRIYLLGFMGAGKSLFGIQLSKLLGFNFIDLDRFIEEKEDNSVSDIFLNAGEDYFRKAESQYLRKIDTEDAVIALGGGTPCFHDNMEYIKKAGISVYLKTETEVLYERLKLVKDERPLISPLSDSELKEYIQSKLSEREKYYLNADIVVHTNGLEPEELKDIIAQYMQVHSSLN